MANRHGTTVGFHGRREEMTKTMRMLLYGDGSAVGSLAFNLGKRIAAVMASTVDILAIARTAERKKVANAEIEAAAAELRAANVSVRIYQRPGSVTRELVERACAIDYHMVVIGSMGRRGIRRLVAGSRACSVLGDLATSVLVVKGREREVIDDILLCSAAGPASHQTVRFAARLARALGASVELLHVMSQVALEEKAAAADLEAEAEALMESDAREGIHLEKMLAILRAEGVEAKPLVRHGLVVEEIVAEAQDGHFDMLVVGAHTIPGIEGLLSSNLAKQIMLSANRPVLIVRQSQRVEERLHSLQHALSDLHSC
jgi:nucleotide-binding universal stress UspA family protein